MKLPTCGARVHGFFPSARRAGDVAIAIASEKEESSSDWKATARVSATTVRGVTISPQPNPNGPTFVPDVVSAATRFRRAIEMTHPHPISFGNFPSGACGATCELLGDYLKDSGLGNWHYVSGVKATEWGGTHAWLEHEGTLVDITGDQFAEVSTKVIVEEAPAVDGRHLGLRRDGAGRPAGMEYWQGATHDDDVAYYERVRRVADGL
jgi:hypothetical protein